MRPPSSDRPWPQRLATVLRVVVVLACVWWIVPAAGARPVSAPLAGGIVTLCDETHLRAALASGGTVTFACSGTITLTEQITITPDTTIDGRGQAVTISGNDTVRVLYVNNGVTLRLLSLSIVDGRDDGGQSAGYGGGVVNRGTLVISYSTVSGNDTGGRHGSVGAGILNNGVLVVDHSTLADNSATGDFDYGDGGDGGGIYNSGTLTVSNSLFDNNYAGGERGHGGGIWNSGTLSVSHSIFSGNGAGAGDHDSSSGGAISSGRNCIVSHSTFSGNSVSGSMAYGGAIGGNCAVISSTFSNNHASHLGSGFYRGYGGAIAGGSTVSHSTFAGNIAQEGGAIFNVRTVTHSTFAGNYADWDGGAISGINSVTSSTFTSNRAGYTHSGGFGGAIYVGGGALAVSNSTFNGNHASWADGSGGLGGGIYVGGGGTLTVTHSTFAGNIAEYDGGGIFTRGALTLQNTIIAHSVMATNCFNDFGQVIDGGGNLSYPDATCPGINADPRLGPLQDNGGPTHTMAPGPGSAAIDAAVDAVCAAPPVNGLDQRGIMRPQGPHCDIGAVEQDQPWTPTPTPTVTPTPTITPTPTSTPTPQGRFFPFVPRGR